MNKVEIVRPYIVCSRVRVEDVEKCRAILTNDGFKYDMIHADEHGRPVANRHALGVKSYEIYRHQDGRVMVMACEFAKGRKMRLDTYLAEVTLSEGF